MRTAGFDLVAQINKNFLNKALAIAFNDNIINSQEIPQLKGSVEVPGLPQELSAFKTIEYELTLKAAPTLDTLIEDIIRINFDIGAALTVFNGLKLNIEAIALVDTAPTYDRVNRTLDINFKNANIFNIVINDTSNIAPQVIEKMNQVIATAIKTGLVDKVENVPLITFSTELPMMPPERRLTIELGAIKGLNQSVLAVAVNFLGFTGGDVKQLPNFNPSNDVCVGMSNDAIHRIFKFWWDNTTHPKEFSQFSTHDLLAPITKDALRMLNLLEKLSFFLVTAGLFLEDTVIDSSSVTLSVKVKLDNIPKLELKANEEILLSCDIHLDLKVEFNVKTTTKATVLGRPKIFNGNHSLDLPSVSVPLTLDKVRAKIFFTQDKRLEAKVENVNVEIRLPWKLPNEVLNWVIDQIEGLITDAINPIPLSPTLISEKIPNTSTISTINIQSLNSDNEDVISCFNITFSS
jgi:hypothetical protein